jgi:hypothetical protein
MTMPDPKAIAAGLSRNQRRLVRVMSPRSVKWRALSRHAKIKVWPWLPAGSCCWSTGGTVKLTPLGLEIKKALTDG